MEFFVLETKQFHAGVKVTEDGEFLRWNAYRKTYEGMASPLQQNERHIAVLADVLATIEFPNRFGMRIAPTFQSLVLVAPAARIDRPKRFDASRVIKADQLKPRIWREIDADNPIALLIKSAAKLVSAETAEFVGRQLALRHTPSGRDGIALGAVQAPAPRAGPRHRIEPTFDNPVPKTPTPMMVETSNPTVAIAGAACKACSKTLGSVLYGKYGYYFKCDACSTNTAIRFSCKPGHSPRLRKDGDAFYRECKECATSSLVHRNAPATQR